ncbi:MAG TPA: class I SAM-dependent methyltransferase [Phenylobacterium sp.]
MSPSREASPFAGTAAYYDRFRAPYPQSAVEWIVESYGLNKTHRALDLGCGPGTIAIALSPTVSDVVALDADEDMIVEGRRLAAVRGRQNIRWEHGKAEDIRLQAGPFQVATLGQSFHWMDRDRVLSKLADLVSDGGGLALVNPGKRRPQESWEPLAGQVVGTFLGPRPRHPSSNPAEPQHEPALRRSPHFSDFVAREFPSRITRDLRSIIGSIYSMSGSSRPLFGHAAEAFETELSQALLDLQPSGIFNEHIETEVLLAPKRAV